MRDAWKLALVAKATPSPSVAREGKRARRSTARGVLRVFGTEQPIFEEACVGRVRCWASGVVIPEPPESRFFQGTRQMRSGVRWLRGLLVAAILCLPGSVRAAYPKVPDEARAHFKIGVEYLNDPGGPRYEDALREFSTAHAIAPSSWKTLNNIGLCALNRA
jgi:hypothetical protein